MILNQTVTTDVLFKNFTDQCLIKYNHGFKRFRLRSKAKVIIEFGLVALAHNIRKWANIRNEMNAVIS